MRISIKQRNLKFFTFMNFKILLAGIISLSTLTVIGQVEQSKDADKRVKPSTTKSNMPTVKDVSKDRPMPVKPAEFISEWMSPASDLKFFELPYAYDQLDPAIDKQTVELHYDKHHRGYFTNFQNAIKGTELEKLPITKIFANISKHSAAVRNNGGGYFNHVIYWQNLSPNGGGEPTGQLAQAINKSFGDYKTFVEKFSEAAKGRFGSGWAWLAVDLNSGELFITSTANQDNPLMDVAERKGIPILGLDVWEHAYYLKYQNKRADYVTAFWTKVNWQDVASKYAGYKELSKELTESNKDHKETSKELKSTSKDQKK